MKTIKTVTTAFQIEGKDALIIGANHDEYFVKTSDEIMIYTRGEMIEIYDLTLGVLTNIKEVLNK